MSVHQARPGVDVWPDSQVSHGGHDGPDLPYIPRAAPGMRQLVAHHQGWLHTNMW